MRLRRGNGWWCVDAGRLSVARDNTRALDSGPVWMIAHRCWMYGPCRSLWGCLWAAVTEWQRDRNLVG